MNINDNRDINKNMNINQSKSKISENMRFFDRWSGTYDKPLFQFWMRRFYRPALKMINKSIKDSVNEVKILDVSSGTGEFLRELTKRELAERKEPKEKPKEKKIKLFGTDLSSKMIAKAREKLGSRAQLKAADVHKLPFSDNIFDYVVSTESFHHYYDQSKALAEMKRVSKKGGKIIVVDINFFLRPIHWLFEKLEPGCVKINSRKEMKSLFQKAGLHNIIQYRSFVFSFITLGIKPEAN